MCCLHDPLQAVARALVHAFRLFIGVTHSIVPIFQPATCSFDGVLFQLKCCLRRLQKCRWHGMSRSPNEVGAKDEVLQLVRVRHGAQRAGAARAAALGG